jgi:2-dehydropantoate 2-reductase
MGEIERVSIIGAGALGGAYLAMIETARPGRVRLIAAGPRLERLRGGLVINGARFRVPVEPPEEASPADLLIVGVKNQHLEGAIRDMAKAVGPQTIILSIMNGIDSERQLASAYGWDRVLYCIAIGIDAVREDAEIRYAAKGKLLLGEAANEQRSPRVQRLSAFLDAVEVPHEVPVDMLRTLWWKYMINIGINQLSAVLRAPYGVFHCSEDARALMADVMREVIAVAAAEGVSLGEEDIDRFVQVLMTLHPLGKTSMLQDVESGRKTEVEMFAGRLVELAERHGLRVPLNETLLRLIRTIESTAASANHTIESAAASSDHKEP